MRRFTTVLLVATACATASPIVRVWSPETSLVEACCRLGARSSWSGDAFDCQSASGSVFRAKRAGEAVTLDGPPQVIADVIVLLGGPSDLRPPASAGLQECEDPQATPELRVHEAHDHGSAVAALKRSSDVLRRRIAPRLKQLDETRRACPSPPTAATGDPFSTACRVLVRELPWRQEDFADAEREVTQLRTGRPDAGPGDRDFLGRVWWVQEQIRVLDGQVELLIALMPYSD